MPAKPARPLLEDMLAYAKEAIDLVGGRDGVAMAADRMRCLAAARTVEVVGEAASQRPADVRAALPMSHSARRPTCAIA